MENGESEFKSIWITVNGDYTPKAIGEDGKMYSIHKSSFMKNSGDTKVKRSVRKGMKFDCDIVEDWSAAPREPFYGVVRFKDR